MIYCFNPLLPNVPQRERLAKIFDFNLRRDHQKISYERRDYESVDEKSIFGYVPKNCEENSGGKGLINMKWNIE